MKKLVFSGILSLFFTMHIFAQFTIRGTVTSGAGEVLPGATVSIKGGNRGAITDKNGIFSLDNLSGPIDLAISYMGFETLQLHLDVTENTDLGLIKLTEITYFGEEVTISAVRAGQETPVAFTDIDREEIEERNYGQDMPYIISLTPAAIVTSDAGHGIGYTSMRIRGTDANRINVTINGIPLNDAESHSVFWVDLPDLASSTEQVQIQRGVGTSTNGAAAFGATINMQTTGLNSEPYFNYDLSAGSFNTFRNSLSLGTGIIGTGFNFDLRLSDLHSDGYIDRSWTDLQSYYLSAGWQGQKSSVKFITFGGYEELYQSWGGVPSTMLESNRTYNSMGEYTDTAGQIAYYDNQIDHYDQFHYQLHYYHSISDVLHLNAALHYTKGAGYYEEFDAGRDYSYYNMNYPVIGSDTITVSDFVRQKWLDNDFFGAIGSFRYYRDRSTIILGGGWNRYMGDHFGKVIWSRYYGVTDPGHQWYSGTGDKIDWNIYSKYYLEPFQGLTGFLDIQVRGINHVLEGTDANNREITQEHSYFFFNPKMGVTYIPAEGHKAFLSYARANREPNRNNYTDAPPGNTPVPETLNDFEAGYSLGNGNASAGITLYYMDYNNQLVLTGEINEVGYPVMTNVDESYRSGIEIEAAFNLEQKLIFKPVIALSRNRIKNFTNYIDNWDYWYDMENEPYQVEEHIGNSSLAYSPEIVFTNLVEYRPVEGFSFSLISRYVGKQYIDNTSNPDYIIDPYFVNDLVAGYTFKPDWAKEIKFSVMVSNVLDADYETNAWLYRYFEGGVENYMDGYYPQAGRYFLTTLGIHF